MFEDGLLVSLPPKETPRAAVPASVFDVKALPPRALSLELSDAIALIESVAAHHGFSVHYVVRPEMFTHGPSLAWLRDKLGPTRHHIALSDGSTARIVPGLHNHVFFYGLARSADYQALTRLGGRMPELLGVFESQINTALSMKQGDKVFSPDPIVLSSTSVSDGGEAQLLRFFLGPYAPEDGVRRLLAAGPVSPPETPFRSVTYAPLTETALEDPSYSRALAAALARCMFDPSSAFVLALPSAHSYDEILEQRLVATLKSLQRAETLIPAAPTPNLFLSVGRLSAEHVRQFGERTALFAHESFDFWRNAPHFYSDFRSIKVIADDRRHAGSMLTIALTEMCGRDVEVAWSSLLPERLLA